MAAGILTALDIPLHVPFQLQPNANQLFLPEDHLLNSCHYSLVTAISCKER